VVPTNSINTSTLTTENPPSNENDTSITSTTTSSSISPTNSSSTTETTPIDTSYTTVELDKLPSYPGGLDNFYEYISTNFEKPELESVGTVTVLVSFVIEIDGSLTNINVIRNPGYGLDHEALRVLKSLKTKWIPGVKDGEKVRTKYTLPIKIKND
jgi:protein TonB